MTCPLYREYSKTRERYFRDMRKHIKVCSEKEKLEQLISRLLVLYGEKNTEYWRKRLASVFNRRFRYINTDWILMLGTLTDCEVVGKYRDPKMVGYLIKLRDLAKTKKMSALCE